MRRKVIQGVICGREPHHVRRLQEEAFCFLFLVSTPAAQTTRSWCRNLVLGGTV